MAFEATISNVKYILTQSSFHLREDAEKFILDNFSDRLTQANNELVQVHLDRELIRHAFVKVFNDLTTSARYYQSNTIGGLTYSITETQKDNE